MAKFWSLLLSTFVLVLLWALVTGFVHVLMDVLSTEAVIGLIAVWLLAVTDLLGGFSSVSKAMKRLINVQIEVAETHSGSTSGSTITPKGGRGETTSVSTSPSGSSSEPGTGEK